MVTITFITSSTSESLEGTAAGSCSGVCGGKSCVSSNWPIGKGNADKGEFEDSISAGALLFKALISACIPPSALSNLAVISLSTALQSTLLTFMFPFFIVKFVVSAFGFILQTNCSSFHLTSCSFCFFFFCFFFCYKFLPHFFMPAIEVFLIRRKWLKWRCWHFIVKRKDKSFFAT